MACPATDHTFCRCIIDRMIHHNNSSYYPKAGFFRDGRTLYDVRVYVLGWHFWHTLVHLPPGFSLSKYTYATEKMYYLTLRFEGQGNARSGVMLMANPTLRGVSPVVHIWRIQKAVREYLRRKKFEQRALAVMMGVHIRMGILCPFAGLPVDVVRVICQGLMI